MDKRARNLLAVLRQRCGPLAVVNLPQVLPLAWLRSTSRMCPHMGVPVGPDWQTLWPPRGAMTHFLPALPAGCLYVCAPLAFVEGRLLRCFEIVTKEKLFWSSHFKNIAATFHLLSQINPSDAALELRLCYREAFNAIVNMCKFPQPICGILKGC